MDGGTANRARDGIIGIGDVVKNRLKAVALELNVLRDAYLATS